MVDEWNVPDNTLTITPQLPAEWQKAAMYNVPFGESHLGISMERDGANLDIQVRGGPPGLHLASRTPGTRVQGATLIVPLPAVEVGVEEKLPPFGSETSQMKVLDEQYEPDALVLRLAAPAGTVSTMDVRENAESRQITVTGATLQQGTPSLRQMQVAFPMGEGYAEKVVTLRW